MSNSDNFGRFEFTTSGGCSRCDNYDGYHDENPGRPHPNCNCEIVDRTASDSGCPYFNITHISNERTPPENNLTMHARVDVLCCIVGHSSELFSVHFDEPNPDDWERRFLATGEAIAQRLMDGCDLIS